MCLCSVGCEEIAVLLKLMTTILTVTKPFKSSIGLTKPFRQPTFVERSTKENLPQSTVSSKMDSSAREPACKPEASIPLFQELLGDDVYHEKDRECELEETVCPLSTELTSCVLS